MRNILEEYLVKIGADIDSQSIGTANMAINDLTGALSKLKTAATVAGPLLMIAGALSAVTKAAVDNIKSVADQDMQYQKLAKDMWITKDSAKALSVAMDTMGASEDDIAWIPELREQFFRLRQEMNELATPVDADDQLKWIREIGYDVQSLFVKLKMFREWLVYFLIKYLEPYIKQFQEFIGWLNEKLAKNMPQYAKKLAAIIAQVVSVTLSVMRAIKGVISGIMRFMESLPANVKKWIAIFTVVGAAIMAGPFGWLLMALGIAVLLIQDFFYYMDGKKSSKTLAPVWEALLKFSEGTGAEWLEKIKEVLAAIADILDRIFKGLDIEGNLKIWKEAVGNLVVGLKDTWVQLDALAKKFGLTKSTINDFFTAFGKQLGNAIKLLGRLVGLAGKLMSALAMAANGDWSGAASVLKDAVTDIAKGTMQDQASVAGNNNGSRFGSVLGSLAMGPLGGAVAAGRAIYNMFGSGKAEAGGRTGAPVIGDVGEYPVAGEMSSGYGNRYCPYHGEEFHDGIDIAADLGTPVMSKSAGTVIAAGYEDGGYGNIVRIRDSNGYQSFYAHLDTVGVSEGDQVSAGQVIGTVGKTGNSTGPHLHWGVHNQNDESVDPTSYNYPSNFMGGGSNNFASNNNSFASGLMSGEQNYWPQMGGNSYGGMTVGDININLPGTTSSAGDIATAVSDELKRLYGSLSMRNQRGVVV